MKKSWIILSIVIILLVSISISGFILLHPEKCEDLTCFNKNLFECSRSSYRHADNWLYQYNIKGSSKEECIVTTELIFAGLEPKFDVIINKKMTCRLPLRMVDFPEKHLEYCSGPLKEELQYLVIKDLYQYTAQGLGK